MMTDYTKIFSFGQNALPPSDSSPAPPPSPPPPHFCQSTAMLPCLSRSFLSHLPLPPPPPLSSPPSQSMYIPGLYHTVVSWKLLTAQNSLVISHLQITEFNQITKTDLFSIASHEMGRMQNVWFHDYKPCSWACGHTRTIVHLSRAIVTETVLVACLNCPACSVLHSACAVRLLSVCA